MITNGKYTLREGMEGETTVHLHSGMVIAGQSGVIRKNIPDRVLLFENEQIDAMIGRIDFVQFIEIFEPHRSKGHGQKFVELIEIEAKERGHNQLIFYPVTGDILEHILQKREYTLTLDEDDNKRYTMNLQKYT